MEFLSESIAWWSSYINEVTGGNAMLASVITASAIGPALYLSRSLPAKIYQFVKRMSITTMTLDNGGFREGNIASEFLEWVSPKLTSKMSRTISVTPTWEEEIIDNACVSGRVVSMGYGTHFFFHNKRFFWVTKTKLDSSGSEKQKVEYSIGTIGRNHEPLKEIIRESTPKPDHTKLDMYSATSSGDWFKSGKSPKKPLDMVAMPDELKNDLIAQVKHFKGNREWFDRVGLPYKMSYILHGIPGTGKTSLIRAVASEFSMNICRINIHQISDSSFEKLMSNAPKNSVIVIEDFDSSSMTKNRTQMVDSDDEQISFLSLTGFLNALDGVMPMDDCILFMTTNHLERIDPAIYRKGRVDYIYELGECRAEDVKKYTERLYPNSEFSGYEFFDVVGCKLNEALLYGKEDPESFLYCLGVEKKDQT